jgi:hypothetical protein
MEVVSMQERVASLIKKLNREHKEDIIRCAQSEATPVRVRMWQDLINLGIIEILPGKALDGWVLTDFGKAVANEIMATKHARSSSPHKPI